MLGTICRGMEVSKTVITSILARMVIVKCRPYGQDPSRKNQEVLGVWAWDY